LLVLGAVVACYFLWARFGFLPMAVLLGPLCLLAMGIRAPRIYAAVWILSALIALLFTRVLGVALL